MLAAVPPWKQGPLRLVGPWGQGHSRASEATSSTFSCGDPGSGALPSHILSRGRASRARAPALLLLPWRGVASTLSMTSAGWTVFPTGQLAPLAVGGGQWVAWLRLYSAAARTGARGAEPLLTLSFY